MDISGVSRAAGVLSNSIQNQIPFPGKSAHFFLKSADSDSAPSLGGRVSFLEFKSRTEGSFLKEMWVNGFVDGHIELCVEFEQSEQDSARKYFRDHGLFQCESNNCHARRGDVKILFDLIVENNTFDPGCVEMIRARIETIDPSKIHDVVDLRTIC